MLKIIKPGLPGFIILNNQRTKIKKNDLILK